MAKLQIIPILVIGVIGYLLFTTFASPGTESIITAQSIGDYSLARTCADATATYTNGAQAGQCYVSTLSNQKSVRYVASVNERSRSCSVTPACPTGSEPICTIDTNQDWSAIFGCDVAYESGGRQIEVCMYDSDCSSGRCINALCDSGPTNECSGGVSRCVSSSTYNTCQASGQWSGNLQCPSGTSCYVNSCKTPTQIQDTIEDGQEDQASGGNSTDWLGDPANQPYIYGGLAVIAFAALN